MATSPFNRRLASPMSLFLGVMLFMSWGCASVVEHESIKGLEKNLGIEKDLLVVQGDLKLFRHCFSERGAACEGSSSTALPHTSAAAAGQDAHPVTPGTSKVLSQSVNALPAGHPAKNAHAVLTHSVTQSAAALHNHLRGHTSGTTQGRARVEKTNSAGGPESTVHMNLGLRNVETFFELLLGSIGGRGFERLSQHCTSLLADNSAGQTAAERTALENECRSVSFINRYLDAYFRNGQLVEVDVDLSGVETDVNQKATEIDTKVSALDGVTQDVDKEVTGLQTQANQKLSNVFKVSSVGFLSRDLTYNAKVPSFEITFNPTASHLLSVKDLETQQAVNGATDFSHLGVMNNSSGSDIGGQLARVFLEALFDSHEGLPALALPVNATGLDVGDFSLPVFNAPMGNVSKDDWQTMTQWNSQVATQVEAVASRVVDGLGVFSINNPAIENLIVEIITVSVRKASEKATWCWFACNLDVAVKQTEADFKQGIEKDEKMAEEAIEKTADRVGGRIEDEGKALVKKVDGYLHHKAEQVRLRLKVDK